MFDLAPDYGAMLVFVEHRYYGVSQPFGTLEASYANSSTLSYMTSEQAIADYAHFLNWLKTDISSPCKGNCSGIPVIAFGGGMLAAWMRMKYPASVAGAIASSAPIWQYTGIVDPNVFNHIVTRTFGKTVRECPVGISRSWSIIRQLAETQEGIQYLNGLFMPCQYLNSSGQMASFAIDYLNTAFSYLAMVDYPYSTSFLGLLPPNPVDYACLKGFDGVTIANATNQTIIAGAHAVASVFYNYSGNLQCSSVGQPSSLGPVDGWSVQSCNEQVMPIGSVGVLPADMFEYSPWDLQSIIQGCEQTYLITPDPYHIPIEFGGMDLSGYSRIFFSNGGRDPWSGGGVNSSSSLWTFDNSKGVVSYLMPDTAHHLDLRGTNPLDPESVIYVRQMERNFISAWIDGYDNLSQENVSSVLASKWIVLISVFSTLFVIIVGAVLFRCCQSKSETRESLQAESDYERMTS